MSSSSGGRRPLAGDELIDDRADVLQGLVQGQGVALVVQHAAVVGAVELQALADADEAHVRFGQRLVAVTACFDGGELGPRPAPDLLAHARPGAVGGDLPALAADVDQVVGDVFLVLKVQGLFAFCMNRVDSGDLEPHLAKRL